MDIRKFFGDKPSKDGKSALSDLRTSRGSPVKSETKKRSESLAKRKALMVELSDSESGGENPIPSSVRKSLKKSESKRKKLTFSSDDDDTLPPSASQARPVKRGEKISPVDANQRKARESETGGRHDDIKSPRKSERRNRSSGRSDTDDSMEENEEADSDFVPAKKSKRSRTPPGQTKISFAKSKGEKAKKEHSKAVEKSREIKKIDPVEFFSNFGKTGDDIDEEVQIIEDGKGKGTPKKAGKDLEEGRRKRDEKKEEKKVGKQHKRDEEEVVKKAASEKASKKEHTKKHKESHSKKESRDSIHEEKSKESSAKKTDSGSPSKKEKLDASTARNLKKEHETPSPSKVPEKEHKKHSSKTEKSPVGKGRDLVKDRGGRKDEAERKREAGHSVTTAHPSVSAAVAPSLSWVDKYKPTSLKQLVGQNGEKSPMNKLLGWLRDWPKYHLGEGAKQKRPRPPPWMAQSDGTSFKAALLSGTPGIGKTTCAIMACKELGLQFVEMNASDSRNKKLLESKVSGLVGCHQVDEYFSGKAKEQKENDSSELTHVLIMDEVDGMSGTEDRAGLAELIQMIKVTKIPIICICNDRQSPKMRSLVNYCFDLRFQRPRIEQIRSRMQTIAFQEKLKLTKEQIDEVIEASNHDVRQTIYNLQLLSLEGDDKGIQQKDCAVNTFEAARRLLNADTPMSKKQEMFFVDYSIMPLFVQENYPHLHSSKKSKKESLRSLMLAADCISRGDVIDRTVRTTGAWGLLNEEAFFSCVLPSMYMNGYMKGMINFPSWLGRNSSTNKRQRLMRQLASHTHLKISADCHSLVTDYVPVLRDRLCRPLVERESDGVREVIGTYEAYDLTRDDSEAIAELAVWPGMNDPGSKIQTKVKAALTRALNKEHRLLPYAVDDISKGRKRGTAAETDLEMDEEGNLVEVGSGDGLNEDDEAEVDEEESPTSKKGQDSSGSTAGRGRGGSAGTKRGGGAVGGRGRGRGKGTKA